MCGAENFYQTDHLPPCKSSQIHASLPVTDLAEGRKHLTCMFVIQVVGLVDPLKLKPGDLVGVNKDSYLVLDTLPAEYDSRVKVSINYKDSSTT